MDARGEKNGKGIIREFGINMYTLLYLKWVTTRSRCGAQGNLPHVVWQPGREKSLGENGARTGESFCCPETVLKCLSAIVVSERVSHLVLSDSL